MKYRLKIILLLQFEFGVFDQLGNCKKDRIWPDGVFELCLKNDGLCSMCPLNFHKCIKKENAQSNQCLVCMKQDQSHNIRYFGIEKCSGVSNSNRIVISIEQKKHIGDWKDL